MLLEDGEEVARAEPPAGRRRRRHGRRRRVHGLPARLAARRPRPRRGAPPRVRRRRARRVPLRRAALAADRGGGRRHTGALTHAGHPRLRSRARRRDRAAARARQPRDRARRRHDDARQPDAREDDGQRAARARASPAGRTSPSPRARTGRSCASCTSPRTSTARAVSTGPRCPSAASEPVAQNAVEFLAEHVRPRRVARRRRAADERRAAPLDPGAARSGSCSWAARSARATSRRRPSSTSGPTPRPRSSVFHARYRRDDGRARRHAQGADDARLAERFRAAGRVGTFVAELVDFFKRFHARTYGWDGSPIHDAVALAHVLRPGSSTTRAPQRRGRDWSRSCAAAGRSSTAGAAPTGRAERARRRRHRRRRDS